MRASPDTVQLAFAQGGFWLNGACPFSGINERPPHIALLRGRNHPLVFPRPVRGLFSQGSVPRVPFRSTHGLRSDAASRLKGSK